MRVLVLVVLLSACGADHGEATPPPPAPPTPPPTPVLVAPPTPEVAPEPPLPALPPGVLRSRGPRDVVPIHARDIAAGVGFACALDEHGAAVCFGSDALRSPPPGPFDALAASDGYVCARRVDGRPACWGAMDGADFVPPPDEPFARIFGARTFTCGLRADGTIGCWGSRDSGRLEAPSGAFDELALHDPMSCGLRRDGHIECWGLSPASLPDEVFGGVAVSAGLACGLRVGGEIVCAGYRASTETPPAGAFASFAPTTSIAGGGGICALRADGEPACFGFDRVVRVLAPPSGPFSSLAVARTFACGIRPPGAGGDVTYASLECWQGASVAPITAHDPFARFETLALGEGFGCAIVAGGAMDCFGPDFRGQARPPSGTFRAIAAGASHTCAIRTDGTLVCWGSNDALESSPPNGTFTAVASGLARSCAIETSGLLRCWGRAIPSSAPQPPVGEAVVALSMSDYVECAALASGRVRCWGDNTQELDVSAVRGATTVVASTNSVVSDGASGRSCFALGFAGGGGSGGGFTAPRWATTICPELPGPLGASETQLCALDAGVVRCLGVGPFDGLGGRASETIEGGPFTSFATGWSHGCAIAEDATLRCWGGDAYGESTPATGRFTAVSPGRAHTCGIRDDGTVACWGSTFGTPL